MQKFLRVSLAFVCTICFSEQQATALCHPIARLCAWVSLELNPLNCDVPSLEVPKAVDGALGSLIQCLILWLATLNSAGGWN